jgi:hypothetical protein
MFAMATHMVFKFFFWRFASVLDVYCKCFNYFGRILQMFPLDIAKVDLVLHMFRGTHLQQSLVAAVGPACMGVDVEGARVGYRAGADRDGAA